MKTKLLLFVSIISLGTLSLLFLFSCNKSADKSKTADNIQLVSPDKKITLAATTNDLLSRINTSTRLNEATQITSVEFINSPKGYFSIVTYRKKDGGIANMVYSNFFISSTSSHLIMETETNTDNKSDATCYEYWCTTAGNCSACQVQVTSPGTNPVVVCTCTQCHLHQRQYAC